MKNRGKDLKVVRRCAAKDLGMGPEILTDPILGVCIKKFVPGILAKRKCRRTARSFQKFKTV